MLGFIDKNPLIEMAWPAIQKKAVDIESAQTV